MTLESLLQRDRLWVGVGLVLVIAISWGWLLAGAGMDTNSLEMARHSNMATAWLQPVAWNPGHAVLMFFMWWVMMAAMMLPAASPVILLAAALNRRSPQSPPYGPAAAFTGGYLLAWGGFSVGAVLAQWGLQSSGLLNPMMASASDRFAGVVLLAAGAWQFTPWKQSCLRHCRSPVEFLSRQRRAGIGGALMTGAHHGLYCLGCCWFLMALLFVGGVMNLYWISGLAIYVLVEKLFPGGFFLARLMGAALVAWGLGLLVY